jgi:arginyl-tRNA synthetase
VRQLLLEEVRRSVRSAFPSVKEEVLERVTLDSPRDPAHGDFATNAAFLLKDHVRQSPRRIAEALVAGIPSALTDVEVAGPGFINFRVRPEGVHAFLRRLADAATRAELLRDPALAREMGRVQIEFVSANPTGPLNVVSARAAAYGDACMRLLRATGVRASSEYYVNDEGTQARLFGESLRARFLQAAGRDAAVPEDGYRGAYVSDLARSLLRAIAGAETRGLAAHEVVGRLEAMPAGATVRSLAAQWGASDGPVTPATVDQVAQAVDFSELGIASMLEAAQESLARFGASFDVFFRESTLHRPGADGRSRLLEAESELEARGHVRVQDGAKWFVSTAFGDDKDRVIRRSTGDPTYLLGDVAYHLDKARRGFDRVIDVWGPDHHGYIKRLHAATVALGCAETWLEIILVQQVNLLRGGQPVMMSKREGELVTLDELVDEVGKDASRFFFLMRKPSSHLDFDLELAKSQTLENPVFYVQYAHARTRSIFRQPLAAPLLEPGRGEADLARLVADEEIAMMRLLLQYPEIVKECSRSLEPHRLVAYLRDVAGAYHRFYTRGKQESAFRVLGDDVELSRARLFLVGALADVLRDGLGLLGIEALEEM